MMMMMMMLLILMLDAAANTDDDVGDDHDNDSDYFANDVFYVSWNGYYDDKELGDILIFNRQDSILILINFILLNPKTEIKGTM